MSNQTLPIITMTVDPQITDRVATCGGTPHVLTTTTTNGVIMDAARIITCILLTPGDVRRTSRDGTTPCNGYVVVRPPRDNG